MLNIGSERKKYAALQKQLEFAVEQRKR